MSHSRKPVMVQWRGETRKLSDLCRQYGLARSTVDKRLLSQWTLEQALKTPKHCCPFCFAEGRITRPQH